VNEPFVPTLVKNDCWLESQTSAITQRIRSYEQRLSQITTDHGSLKEYASAHHHLGIHSSKDDQQWIIREWAPGAKAISLIGTFNNWDEQAHPLTLGPHGIWETKLPKSTLQHESLIKLFIHGADDSQRHRIPAYITRTRQDPNSHDFSAQIWAPETSYQWQHDFDPSSISAPLIYEAHVGMAGQEPRVHSYREFADHILPRIATLGYNTIQLMAVQEHPYYGSFGYHVSNFFAACSRFGTPEDLKYLIDTAHGLGLAVLLDIVHSHAVKNLAEGLNDFDGTDHLYFHGGEKGDHPQWDSKCFDYSKQQVEQFLLSNVRYWLEEFHFDGFRFDGITSMLYEHHGNIDFDHYDKYFQEGVDHHAITYLQLATTLSKELRPGALIIAEDMSGMPGLCRPIQEGGIGFTHRLAMGVPDYWIKLLKHQRDEDWDMQQLYSTLSNRRHGERNICYVESHDQALVGDKTIAFWLMDKEMYEHMSAQDTHPVIDRGIALHKMIRLITFAAAGEGYLTFMGNEFGHPEWLDFPREGNQWSFQYCRRQWDLVDNTELKYKDLNNFDRSMIHLGQRVQSDTRAHERWLHNTDKIIAFDRGGYLFVFNFHPTASFTDYGITIYEEGIYNIILNTDSAEFGGHNRIDETVQHQTRRNTEGQTILNLYLPCRTAIVLQQS